MTIFDIRGTHGSGKSHTIKTLLKAYESFSVEDNGVHQGYEIPSIDMFVVGKYNNVCGGCDGIKTADEVERRVRHYGVKYTHLILEGILVSHTFSRYNKLAIDMEKNGVKYVFCFYNTPLDICIKRVKKRRAEKGNKKKFDPKNVIKDHKNIWTSVRSKMEKENRHVEILDWKIGGYNSFRKVFLKWKN